MWLYSVVSSLAILPQQPSSLLSSGGDGYVRLWKYVDGALLSSLMVRVIRFG